MWISKTAQSEMSSLASARMWVGLRQLYVYRPCYLPRTYKFLFRRVLSGLIICAQSVTGRRKERNCSWTIIRSGPEWITCPKRSDVLFLVLRACVLTKILDSARETARSDPTVPSLRSADLRRLDPRVSRRVHCRDRWTDWFCERVGKKALEPQW